MDTMKEDESHIKVQHPPQVYRPGEVSTATSSSCCGSFT